jgi:hypothetical protein
MGDEKTSDETIGEEKTGEKETVAGLTSVQT